MHRPFSNLGFAVVHALFLIAATLVAGSSRGPWQPFAAPLLLVLGLLGVDLVVQRRRGLRLPSAGACLLAAAILVASAIVLPGSADHFAAFVPILGCSAVAPVLWRDGARAACGVSR